MHVLLASLIIYWKYIGMWRFHDKLHFHCILNNLFNTTSLNNSAETKLQTVKSPMTYTAQIVPKAKQAKVLISGKF